uniref:Uncharacterized protein n=1 Tax=Sphaerodactylus townsendi TaxID=933632 RepID=A0ACB8F7L2_9SAUR
MTSLETQQGEVSARAEAGHPISAELTGTLDSASDPAEGPRMLSGEATASGGDPTPTGLSDSTNLFLTAPLDGSQGVTVRRHRGPDYYRDSQTVGLGSASWAMAPLAGNVSVTARPFEVADSSEAEAWRMLQASDEAWDFEREEYHQALHQMEPLLLLGRVQHRYNLQQYLYLPRGLPLLWQRHPCLSSLLQSQLPAPAAFQVPAAAPVHGQPPLPPPVQPAPVRLPALAAFQAPAATPVHGQQPLLLAAAAPAPALPRMQPFAPPVWGAPGGALPHLAPYGVAPPPLMPRIRLTSRFNGTQDLLPAFLVQAPLENLQVECVFEELH